jgi:acyl-CoA thioesterase I
MQKIKSLLAKQEPIKWLFYGDSITHGARHTYGNRDYPELFSERIRYELGRLNDIIINTAISGNTTRQLLDGFNWRVKQLKPNVVFIMIGMNDCSSNNDISLQEFEGNLTKLCNSLYKINSLPVLQTTCPILPGQAPDRLKNFNDYMDIIRTVAENENIPFIDHAKFWNKNADAHFFWMNNAFHPNAYGHRVFANYIYDALGIYDVNSQSCKLFVPDFRLD